jgi:hypothetical protein
MSDIKDTYTKLQSELRPFYEALIRECYKRGLYTTGFIYADPDPKSVEGPFLIRFGNIWTDSPAEMFLIHWQLAQMAAAAEQAGNMDREITHMEPSDASPQISGPKGPNSLEIADMLVLSLLATPLEMLPDQVGDLLKQYAESRKPEKA